MEQLLDFTRRNFLVPVPAIGSLERLNEQLWQCCQEDLKHQLRGKPSAKNVLLIEEQSSMLPLPKQTFDAHRHAQANANSLSLVRFDRNSYSVPTKFAYRLITIVTTFDKVRFSFDDQLIARHKRCWDSFSGQGRLFNSRDGGTTGTSNQQFTYGFDLIIEL